MDSVSSSRIFSCLPFGVMQKEQVTLTVGVTSFVAGVALLALKADLFGLGTLALAGLPIAFPVGLCITGSLCILAAAILFSKGQTVETLNTKNTNQKAVENISRPPKEQYIASYQLNLQPDLPDSLEKTKLSLQPLDANWRLEHAKDYGLTEESSLDWENLYKGGVKMLECMSEVNLELGCTEVKILLSKNFQKLNFMCYADRIVVYTSAYGSEIVYGAVGAKGRSSNYPGFSILSRTFDALVKEPNNMQFDVKDHFYAANLYDENSNWYNHLTITIKNLPLTSLFW